MWQWRASICQVGYNLRPHFHVGVAWTDSAHRRRVSRLRVQAWDQNQSLTDAVCACDVESRQQVRSVRRYACLVRQDASMINSKVTVFWIKQHSMLGVTTCSSYVQ